MSKDLLIRCGPPWAPWLVRPDAKTTIVALDKACQAFDLTVVTVDGEIHLTQATPCEEPPAPVALAQCLFGTDANFDITVDGRGYPGMTEDEALGEVEDLGLGAAIVEARFEPDEALKPPPGGMNVVGTLSAHFDGEEIPNDREIPEAIVVKTERGVQ